MTQEVSARVQAFLARQSEIEAQRQSMASDDEVTTLGLGGDKK
jgi:hypothetical protein